MRTVLVAVLFITGCGSDNKCTPGQSIACACANQMVGAQVCRADGTFDPCQCEGIPMLDMTSGGGGDMATSSTGDMAISAGDKRVFVTSTAYVGSNRATLLSACQNAALAQGLGGTWVGWLSFSGTAAPQDAVDAVNGNGPWKRLDGQVAFANHAQLATQPSVPINITETGSAITLGAEVWTGTETGGRVSGFDCGSWMFSGDRGKVGSTGSTGSWTGYSDRPCSDSNHVYCFEQ